MKVETKEKNMSEAEVRQLRDEVFEHRSTEEGWAACKENWLRADSVAWLKEWAERMKGTR
jgi:hypothetical protein